VSKELDHNANCWRARRGSLQCAARRDDLGKDAYRKNEKTNKFNLALDGEEAGKLALPLQQAAGKQKNRADQRRSFSTKNDLAAIAASHGYKISAKRPTRSKRIARDRAKTAGVDELEKPAYKVEIAEFRKRRTKEQAIAAAKTEIESANTSKAEEIAPSICVSDDQADRRSPS
jgi:hypothetical protein